MVFSFILQAIYNVGRKWVEVKTSQNNELPNYKEK